MRLSISARYSNYNFKQHEKYNPTIYTMGAACLKQSVQSLKKRINSDLVAKHGTAHIGQSNCCHHQAL
jgi:hypothetical protein